MWRSYGRRPWEGRADVAPVTAWRSGRETKQSDRYDPRTFLSNGEQSLARARKDPSEFWQSRRAARRKQTERHDDRKWWRGESTGATCCTSGSHHAEIHRDSNTAQWLWSTSANYCTFIMLRSEVMYRSVTGAETGAGEMCIQVQTFKWRLVKKHREELKTLRSGKTLQAK